MRAPHALQFVGDLQAAHSVASNHVWVVVGRGLHGVFLFGDLARKCIALTRQMVGGNVVGANLGAKGARALKLDLRRSRASR